MRPQNVVQMKKADHYLDDSFGHPFLQVQPPKSGEVNQSSLELKCFGEVGFSLIHPAA